MKFVTDNAGRVAFREPGLMGHEVYFSVRGHGYGVSKDGFGFAGALAEVGLPHHAIPIALLFFNVGVEIGQLVFVAAVLMVGEMFRRAIALRLDPVLVQRTVNRLDLAVAYVIGAVAAYWLIERTSAFFV